MQTPQKIILKNQQSPGDVVMLTAAIRDLHRAYPDRYLTDVRTSCPDLWLHNPYITPLADDEPDTHHIDCRYPLIQQSNQRPYHFLHGFTHFLNRELKLAIRPSEIRGDIHLSMIEKRRPSLVATLTGTDIPFWIIVAGGKWDCTIKWWDTSRYQEVVDAFRGRILFVQIGHGKHHHPPLNGVLDLRGKTTLRDLVNLIYHAQGVLCSVTAAMHLAAAVPAKSSHSRLRPCVVVAGGREPPHWESYPGHQFIHTVGMLPCCANGGCWKSRTVPLGDGAKQDQPKALCKKVTPAGLPACMDMITAQTVCQRIEGYFNGGMAEWLTPEQARLAVSATSSGHSRSTLHAG